MTTPTRPRPRRPSTLWLIVFAVIVLIAYLLLHRKHEGPAAETPPVVTVETAIAEVRTFAVSLSAIGTVAPRPGYSAELAAPAPTIVTRVYVGTGDHVVPGQPLVALDTVVFAAQTAQAETAFRTAEAAYERARRLVAEGILPRKDEETAASELATARTALVQARLIQSAAVLRSPIVGVVTRMNARLAAPADVTQPLVEVVNPAGLEVLFHLSAGEAARIRPGSPVELNGGPDSTELRLGAGTVRSISAAVDSMLGSVDVRASVTSSALPLRVGQSVNGQITVAEHPNAVVVPLVALVPAESGVQVFVVDAAGVAHATPVSVGARSDTEAEILSGLHGGERVVTIGAYGVTDGARVVTGSTQ
jgi:RND family efflux transporter MFP subunit